MIKRKWATDLRRPAWRENARCGRSEWPSLDVQFSTRAVDVMVPPVDQGRRGV